MKENDHTNYEADRTAALLALASSEKTKESGCISDDTLAAFLEQRLDEDKRAEVLEHMASCSVCMARCTGTFQFGTTKTISRFRRRLYASGMGLAAAALLIVFLYVPHLMTENPTQILSRSFDSVETIVQKTGDRVGKGNVKLPWEVRGSHYGFAGNQKPGDMERAFLSGLFAGKQAFATAVNKTGEPVPGILKHDSGHIKNGWKKTPFPVYFQLGKWCYLMKTIDEYHLNMSNRFAARQAKFLTLLTREIKKSPDYARQGNLKLAVNRMAALSRVFDNMAEQKGEAQQWRRVGAEADMIIQLLSAG